MDPSRTPAPALGALLVALDAPPGPGAEPARLAVLAALCPLRIRSREGLLALHERLLALRALPDSRAVRDAVEAALRDLPRRVAELTPATREALDESGLAGTALHTTFSLPAVRWLRARFPDALRFYPAAEGTAARLAELLPRMLPPAEAEALADGYLDPLRWLDPATPGALDRLLARLDAHVAGERARTALWSAAGLSVRWDLGADEGSRTLARAPCASLRPCTRPLDRRRPDLREEIARGPLPVRRARPQEARRWIDAACAATLARLREMHTFLHGSVADVSVAVLPGGVDAALVGVRPEQRHPARCFYGFLLARNGVPVAYGDALLLFAWCELNFHVFETFRGTASAQLYASLARLFVHHFRVRYLHLNRYQFGHHNEEAIRTGAFWFYEKLGFRPVEPALQALARQERARLAQDPGYRTPPAVLRRLAAGPMALGVRGPQALYDGFHPLHLGLAWTRRIESVYGGDPRRALRAAVARVGAAVAGPVPRPALEALAPVLDLIPGIDAWSLPERRALAAVVRAKAAARERDYLLALQAHARLRKALTALGRAPGGP